MLCSFNIQNCFICSSIRYWIAYANEANIVNKDSHIQYSLLVYLTGHVRDILGLWSAIHRVMLGYSLISTHFNFQQLVIGGITGGCWSWDIPSNIQFNAQSWRNTFFLWKDKKTFVEILHECTISTTSRLKTHSFLVAKIQSCCRMWLATCEQLCRIVSTVFQILVHSVTFLPRNMTKTCYFKGNKETRFDNVATTHKKNIVCFIILIPWFVVQFASKTRSTFLWLKISTVEQVRY